MKKWLVSSKNPDMINIDLAMKIYLDKNDNAIYAVYPYVDKDGDFIEIGLGKYEDYKSAEYAFEKLVEIFCLKKVDIEQREAKYTVGVPYSNYPAYIEPGIAVKMWTTHGQSKEEI